MKNFVFLSLLAHFIQAYANPGRNHDFYQPSWTQGTQWNQWGHSWNLNDWFQPHTTQRPRTRKHTTQKGMTQFHDRTTSSNHPTTARTPHLSPVTRDVEIRIKPEQAADVSFAPSRINLAEVGGTASDATVDQLPTKTTTSDLTAQIENTDFKLNIAEEIAMLSPDERDQMFTTPVSEDSPTVKERVNTIDTPVSDQSSSHWHVGIYRKTEMPYMQICGGSLIKTDTVISAGNCFWTLKTKLLPADQFAAAAGKVYRAWNDPRDSNAQYSDIQKIVITQRFRPCRGPHLAILILATPFRFVDAVKPACLGLTDKENLTTKDIGLTAGWGIPSDGCKTSERVVWSSLPFVNTLNCSSETERFGDYANKIYAGDSSSRTQCNSDGGSGLIFYNKSVPYLRGVATFAATDSPCVTYNTPSFSPAGQQFRTFDKAFELLLKDISSLDECQNFYESGHSQKDTNQIQTGQSHNETNQIQTGQSQNETNRIQTGQSQNVTNQIQTGQSQNETNQIQTGQPQNETNQIQTGQLQNETKQIQTGQSQNVTNQIQTGQSQNETNQIQTGQSQNETNQIQTGQSQKETNQSQNIGSSETTQSDQSDILNTDKIVTSVYETLVTIPPEEENLFFGALGTMSTPVPTLGNTSAPAYQWHVGVYSKAFSPFMQICGGTLVKLDVVISAAHCFWVDATGQQPATQFAVAGGKLYRPWNSTKDTFAQFSDVSEIIIPARFRGETTSFQDDVAILRLSSTFAVAPGVRPACVHFGQALEREQLVGGNEGTVAGWGLTEMNGTPSQRLNYLELPYVEINDCFDTAEPSFLKYITSDKICAGDQITGKALCRGDSGGGLILFSGTTPYVRGVASTAPNNNNLCNAFAIATFTQLYAHRTFLRDNIPDVEKCTETGNDAESVTGNDAERAPFGTGNRLEMEGNKNGTQSGTVGNGVGTETGYGETGNDILKPPEFVPIEGPTAAVETTETSTVPPHLVPYYNFVCNCHCKS